MGVADPLLINLSAQLRLSQSEKALSLFDPGSGPTLLGATVVAETRANRESLKAIQAGDLIETADTTARSGSVIGAGQAPAARRFGLHGLEDAHGGHWIQPRATIDGMETLESRPEIPRRGPDTLAADRLASWHSAIGFALCVSALL